MTQWIALLRGINVGGNKKVPMAELRALADRLWPIGKSRTYIASGNLMFEAEGTADDLAEVLAAEIHDTFGFDVPVLVMKAKCFTQLVAACPYDADELKHVHGYFCFEPPQVDTDLLGSLQTEADDLTITDRVIWLHTRQGFSKSKLAEKMIRVAGVSLTARNLNSCRKLVEMLDG